MAHRTSASIPFPIDLTDPSGFVLDKELVNKHGLLQRKIKHIHNKFPVGRKNGGEIIL